MIMASVDSTIWIKSILPICVKVPANVPLAVSTPMTQVPYKAMAVWRPDQNVHDPPDSMLARSWRQSPHLGEPPEDWSMAGEKLRHAQCLSSREVSVALVRGGSEEETSAAGRAVVVVAARARRRARRVVRIILLVVIS